MRIVFFLLVAVIATCNYTREVVNFKAHYGILSLANVFDDILESVGRPAIEKAAKEAAENIEKKKRIFLCIISGIVLFIGGGAFIYLKKRRDKKRKVSST